MKIVVIDDESGHRDYAISIIKKTGDHEITPFDQGIKAIQHIQEGNLCDFVLTDYIMGPGIDGISTAQGIREHNLEVPIYLMSTINAPLGLNEYGINGFISKFDLEIDLPGILKKHEINSN